MKNTTQSLVITHPDLLQDWSVKNTISPEEVTYGSRKRVTWLCHKCGYEWETTVKNRALSHRGCAVCSGKKVMSGYNDVGTMHPELANFYDTNKNARELNTIASSDRNTYWWLCDKGHSFQKRLETMINNTFCPVCSIEKKTLCMGSNDLLTVYPSLVDEFWDYDKNDKLPQELTLGSGYNAWWKCPKTGTCFQRDIWDFINRTKSSPYEHSSNAEQEIKTFITSHYEGSVISNTRSLIPPQELDIYIPEKNIAIEFNGIYWHTEQQGKDKWYHYNKWKKCQDIGIQLITIWEDDYNNNPELIRRMLLHKLGISTQNKVYARKTFVDNIDKREAREFCDKYHIQRFVPGSIYVGLREKNTQHLVAVAIYRRNGSILTLIRYCTSSQVVGGMGKLLKSGIDYAVENGIHVITTFSDNEISDGNLYRKLGFNADKELAPDYKYVYKGKRVHKFNFRLRRFKNDQQLKYHPDLSEKELAQLNSIPRVWDCGKTRWIYVL